MSKTINLKDYYYWYTEDSFVDVEDDVAEELFQSKRDEHAYWEQLRYNRAYYSLEANRSIEAVIAQDSFDDPQTILEMRELHCELCHALNSLSEIQGRRIEGYFLHEISETEIAKAEGAAVSSVCESLYLGLQKMKIFLKNPKKCPKKCPLSLLCSRENQPLRYRARHYEPTQSLSLIKRPTD
ncbi:MAG: sigma-70 family RNA polymerase sigma factor [Dehalococcoidia bacterium]|nr:sigma-70 family RNA polymerase sigma factor [Dehalococcoidia bacterium]